MAIIEPAPNGSSQFRTNVTRPAMGGETYENQMTVLQVSALDSSQHWFFIFLSADGQLYLTGQASYEDLYKLALGAKTLPITVGRPHSEGPYPMHLWLPEEERAQLMVWLDGLVESKGISGLGATVYGGDLGLHEAALRLHGSPRVLIRATLFVPTEKSRTHRVPQIQFMSTHLGPYVTREHVEVTAEGTTTRQLPVDYRSLPVDLDSRDLKLNVIPMWRASAARRALNNALYFSLVNPSALLVRIDEVLSNNPSFKGLGAPLGAPVLYRALQKRLGPVVRIVSQGEGNKKVIREMGHGLRWGPTGELLFRERPNPSYKPNPFLDETENVPWDPNGLNLLYLREPYRYDDLLGMTDEVRQRAAHGEPFLIEADGRTTSDELIDTRWFLILDNQLYSAPYQFHDVWWQVVDESPALVEAVRRQDWRTVRVFIDEVLSRLKPLPPGTMVR